MAVPENYVSRDDLGWGPSPAAWANLTHGLVVHYDSSNLDLADKPHSACIAYWHATRSFHTGPSRGWVDIGYSFMACPHDYILEGRGIDRQQAAQPGGNATHYSVTLATGPAEEIPAAQINAVRRLRKWLMEDHDNRATVLGHRDFVSTSCPGAKAYALVQNGTFAQAPGAVINMMGMEHMLELKKGDTGVEVQDLQVFLNDAGFRPANSYANGNWDGVYGQGVSDAVLALRKSLGSDATSGDRITYWAMNQMRRAWFKRQFELAMEDAELPEGNGASMPATETVRVSGTLEVER